MRTLTQKGKYNAHKPKQAAAKRIPERGSESENSSEEEIRRPRKKRSRTTKKAPEDDEEQRYTTSSVEDIIKVSSDGVSESESQVSV
jgi:hypothetical protein